MKNGVMEIKLRRPFLVPGALDRNGENQALLLQ